jgi:hypothetical protein
MKMASKSLPPVNELFQIFQAMAGQNEELSLTRSFHGLSLKQGAAVTKVEEGKIFLKLSNYPVLAGLDGPIYVQHKRIFHLVCGSFHIDNLNTGMGALSEVRWIRRKWKNRIQDRVQPQSKVYIDIEYRNQSMRGNLDNISTSGMAVFVNKSFEPLVNLDSSKTVLLRFKLSPQCEYNALTGTIVYLQTISSNLIRLGIKFIPHIEELGCLKAYISNRKAEILVELGQTYRDSETRSQVTNLYF